MKLALPLALALSAAVLSPAVAGNILPGSGATVVGSSIHSGFNSTIAGGNLINGTSAPAFFNGDPRWVFADGSGAEETLTVDLGSLRSIGGADVSYSGVDRIPASFSVLTSTDGVNFTNVGGPIAPAYGNNVTYTETLQFGPTTAQYVEFDFGTDSIGTGCPGCGGGPGQGAGIVQLSVEAVPEPAAWALMLVGVASIGGLARRRREHFAPAA